MVRQFFPVAANYCRLRTFEDRFFEATYSWSVPVSERVCWDVLKPVDRGAGPPFVLLSGYSPFFEFISLMVRHFSQSPPASGNDPYPPGHCRSPPRSETSLVERNSLFILQNENKPINVRKLKNMYLNKSVAYIHLHIIL